MVDEEEERDMLGMAGGVGAGSMVAGRGRVWCVIIVVVELESVE